MTSQDHKHYSGNCSQAEFLYMKLKIQLMIISHKLRPGQSYWKAKDNFYSHGLGGGGGEWTSLKLDILYLAFD